MPERLDPNGQFIVKDSAVALLIMGIAFSAMLFCAIYYNANFGLIPAACLGLLPVILIILRLRKRGPAIVINRNGIMALGTKVTDWQHFVKAHFTQKEASVNPVKNLSDNFILIVEYRKDGRPGLFKTTIPLSNTQDKSEEAVLEAVYFYYRYYKK